MIDVPLSGWLGFGVLISMAQFAGVRLSRCLPWSAPACRAGIPTAFGHALGPFLAGVAAVLVLQWMPGAPHASHLMAIAAMLVLLALATLPVRQRLIPASPARQKIGSSILQLFLFGWMAMLVVNAVFLPLTQNDALEYALVGRLLFATGDLASYPAIDPAAGASGFFGPWTHPPLYVALIYLMHALQGSADAPGLMRLVSPWFALAATVLCYRLGGLYNRRFGLFAALIFLSTPLMFSGADSGQIDPLPVLGMLLVIAAIVGLETGTLGAAAAIGVVLGLSLWTHSQAILFVPLAIVAFLVHAGLRNLPMRARGLLLMLVCALAIGAWPYVRNMLIFGSPISDNPVVFAMAELSWPDYFRVARGLDNWLAVVQYGLFKGWFAVISFGWTFWLMAAGAVILLRRLRWRGLTQLLRNGADTAHAADAMVMVCLSVTLTYLAGTLASVALGLDLMIKNERYLLVLLPLVSLCGAYAMESIASRAFRVTSSTLANVRRMDRLLLATSLAIALLAFQLLYVGWYYKWRLVPSNQLEAPQDLTDEGQPRFGQMLDSHLNIRAVRWMNKAVPKEAVVLAMRPADMYYARQRMVSYLDPSLVPVYRAQDPDQALRLLLGLGITHVQSTDYGSPVTYNTVLGRLLASPEHASLIHASGGTHIYKLGDSGRAPGPPLDFTPGKTPWMRWVQPLLPGLNSLARYAGYRGSATRTGAPVSHQSRFPFAHRDFSTLHATDEVTPLLRVRNPQLAVTPQTEYRVTLRLEGQAFVRVWLAQFDARGQLLTEAVDGSATRIDELVVTPERGVVTSSRRFLTLPDAVSIRIGVEQLGYSSLRIDQATLEEIRPR